MKCGLLIQAAFSVECNGIAYLDFSRCDDPRAPAPMTTHRIVSAMTKDRLHPGTWGARDGDFDDHLANFDLMIAHGGQVNA